MAGLGRQHRQEVPSVVLQYDLGSSFASFEQFCAIGSQLAFWTDKPIEGLPGDTEFRAEVGHFRFRLSHRSLSKAQFRRRHLERRSAVAAPCTGGGETGFGSLDDQRPLELSKRSEYAKHQPAIRR